MNAKNFRELLRSVRQAGEIRQGTRKPGRTFRYAAVDVKKIRMKLKLTQAEFARMLCVNLATLRNWEQGRTCPEGAAVALLRIADAKPEAVLEALHPKKAA